jgi:hypothetical protein
LEDVVVMLEQILRVKKFTCINLCNIDWLYDWCLTQTFVFQLDNGCYVSDWSIS